MKDSIQAAARYRKNLQLRYPQLHDSEHPLISLNPASYNLHPLRHLVQYSVNIIFLCMKPAHPNRYFREVLFNHIEFDTHIT